MPVNTAFVGFYWLIDSQFDSQYLIHDITMTTLKGKTVFISGASAGIGRDTAVCCAEAGARLILTARRKDRLETLAHDLKQEFGTESYTMELDVRDYNAVKASIYALPEEWKMIDMLINNAGLSRGLDTIQEGLMQDWEEMIDTNVKGLLYVTREILPQMVARKQGTVVNLGSIAGKEVYPKGNVYCATKHAVRALSQAMYRDTNGSNVRVINIDPGMVETEFSEVRFHGDAARAKAVYHGLQPLSGRDIAEVILFAITRPAHVTLHDIQIMPTAQAAATIVHRS
jgi:3-hydroxy acid dehydrogenase / malonic semialdehyde reductase